ncbi:Replication factor C subunit 1 [Acipenser ruthenus]|uniref:Replication factor C subunit 1 n=1 Tax=Acipenser ruthenus TaxID=7906 RepID=A0A444UKC9_ACIRT|nr:Replication factor C subunit 1 [Acipenser ruthenus]
MQTPDIRKFFVVQQQKKSATEPAKNGKAKREYDSKKKSELPKVKSLNSDDGSAKKMKQQANKKKHIIIDSDFEEEVPVQKHRKPSKESPKESKSLSKPARPPKKDPVVYVSETDEEDNFESLKQPPKRKENGLSASSRSGSTGRAAEVKPPAKPAPPKAVTPVKCTPTSVFDYFGDSSVQRSHKKLVATTKRKAPTGCTDDSTNEDEAIARQLQMDEDAELERQLREDEDFARTLAILDEPPQSKKARKDSEDQQPSASLPVKSPVKPDRGTIKQEAKESDVGSKDPPPKKPSPIKASSKLVLIKQKEETSKKEVVKKTSVKEKTISPKKEEMVTPKTEKISPKKSESKSPEDSEKKRQNLQTYRSYLNRDGPRALGSKEVPKGADNCLEGLTFVLTGVLESMERDDAKSLIERYGGKVTGNISKKTNYLVLGRDSGVSKTEKAESLGTNILDEDGLLDLIRKQPGKRSKYEIAAQAEGADNCLEGLTFVLTGVLESMERDDAKSLIERYGGKVTGNISKKTNYLVLGRDSGVSKTEKAESLGTNILDEDGLLDLIRKQPGKRSKYEIAAQAENTPEKTTPPKRAESAKRKTPTPPKKGLSFQQKSLEKVEPPAPSENKEESLLWVDRYKPTSLKNIIGQQGDQSCANKLLRWLRNWHHNTAGDKKPAAKFSKFGGKDDGSTFKAALLSGPPGVGKTTTAALVCEELGFSYVEQNASCTRSKNSLKVVIAESLNNTSIKNFYSGTSHTVSNKHVLIMDEVDGMAGNEDRGGIQELIGLIKNTKIPIICMCNDRNHQKIRSLVNYCFDLRFQRPRVEQIKTVVFQGAMMSVAFKEGLKVPPPALNEIILAANQDIRQVLHNLSMWSARDKVLTYDQAKSDASKARKDVKMGPFDVCRKVFAAGDETAHMSLIDKSDLFFHDYSLAPLFVQENYVHVRPAAAGGNVKKHLMLLSRTADSICDGDLVDRQIRSRQTWTLLPTQAIYASVLPGELMRGYMSQFPTFPSWLGKFSATGKHDRIIQELSMHMCLRTHISKRAVNMEYLPFLRDSLVRPMAEHGAEGVSEAVQLMDDYCLMKEDVDNIMEISTWGGRPDPFSKLDPKVKSAFTRTYNKETHLTPYSLQAVKKAKRGAGSTVDLGDEFGTEDTQPEDKESEDTIETDAMIKQKKAKSSKSTKHEKTCDSGKGKEKAKKTK